MTSRIYSTLIEPDGTPIQGATISIDLLWNRRVQAVADSPEYFIEGRWASLTDANGLWEIDLLSNTEITPTGSVYRITEKPKRYSYFPTIYYVSVPADSATPVDYYVGDIEIDKPDWV